MNDPTPALRALAASLDPSRPFVDLVADDDAAVRRVVDVVHGGACPRCHGTSWRPDGERWLACDDCSKRSSIYRASPLQRRKISARILLAAVHAILVDTRDTSARGFARLHDFHVQTGWRLLHTVRAAIPMGEAATPGARAQMTGFVAEENAADAIVALDAAGDIVAVVAALADGHEGDADDVIDADDTAANDDVADERGVAGADAAAPPPQASLLLGRLRAWLSTVFRWVSRDYLANYLREFAARVGRVAQVERELQRSAQLSRRKAADRCSSERKAA